MLMQWCWPNQQSEKQYWPRKHEMKSDIRSQRQDSRSLENSQHAGKSPGGEPKKSQLQQQAKPKPKHQLKHQSEPQHQPRPMTTTTQLRRFETFQPETQSLNAPTRPVPAQPTESSIAERCLKFRTNQSVPLHDTIDQETGSAINAARFSIKHQATSESST
jgi:hypothetical protein